MMTRSLLEVLPPATPCYPNSNWLHGYRENGSGIWTHEENKRFEDALAKYDRDSPDRWERVAALIPGKTAQDVENHYKDLEEDVSEIEAGRLPFLGSGVSSFTLDWENNYAFEGLKQAYGIGRKRAGGRVSDQERKKGVPWTEEEHRLFLHGLKKYGKGDWRNISQNFVISRTPTQVASHAQKYFIRLNSGVKDKRRSSIHDITTANLPENKPLSPSQPSTVTSISGSSASPALSGQFSVIVDSNQPTEVSSLFGSSTHGNQFMQGQFGATPFGMKLQPKNLYNATPHDSMVPDHNILFQMQPSRHIHPH